MSRFFVTDMDESSEVVSIKGDDFNHIKNVLRYRPGDSITLCDGKGFDYQAYIEGFEKDRVIIKITDRWKNSTEPPIDIVLFQGIPKGDKTDFIIQKTVELGVKRIIPLMCERTVLKFESQKDMEKKRMRWQRIALEAAKQCNRGIIPEVSMPVKFEEALEYAGSLDLAIMPYEKEKERTIKWLINGSLLSNGQAAKSIGVFIGPEGGFSEKETELASRHEITMVTLGPRILRTETAGLAVVAILMYELGDIGKY